MLTVVLKSIDWISKKAFDIASYLLLLLVILVVQQVIARYFFKSSSVAIQELEWHLFGAIICLSIAHTLSLKAHVCVDIFSASFSEKTKRVITAVGCLLLLPLTTALFYYGIIDVAEAIGERSPDPGGLPARWVVRSFFPLGMLLLFFQSLSLFIQNIMPSVFRDLRGAK